MKKYLFIRFSSIGDIVLTSPLLRCLREKEPDCQIHYLCKVAYRPILDGDPYIDEIIVMQNNIWDIIPQLRKEKYDFIIDLQRNRRSRLISLFLNRPGATFPKLNFKKWMLVNLKKDTMPDLHIVDRYFQALEPLGITYDGKGLEYFVNNNDIPPEQLIPWNIRPKYIAVAMGSKQKTKDIPLEILSLILEKSPVPIVLLGGKDDIEKAEALIKKLSDVLCVNLCGKLGINQSAWLVRNSWRVLSPDTGLMHIAAAYRKEVVSVWGNTVPAFGMTPFYPDGMQDRAKIFEVKELSCRPCSKLGYKECPKNHFDCMMKQNVDAIRETLYGISTL